MNKSVGYRWLHSRTAMYYKTLDKLFTYPIVIASTLFGMGGFAMIGIAPDYEETPRWEKTLNYVFAMVNLGVAVLVSVQKMSGYAEKSEVHNLTATQYTKFYREINLELALDHQRVKTEKICRKMKKKYDELLDNAPEIPRYILKQFDRKFPNSVIKPDIVK